MQDYCDYNCSYLQRYELYPIPIGQGTGGIVFRAKDLRTGKGVAIKNICQATAGDVTVQGREIFLTSSYKHRLEQAFNEIQLHQSLKHPNIIQFYECFYDVINQKLCIVMELAEGMNFTNMEANLNN